MLIKDLATAGNAAAWAFFRVFSAVLTSKTVSHFFIAPQKVCSTNGMSRLSRQEVRDTTTLAKSVVGQTLNLAVLLCIVWVVGQSLLLVEVAVSVRVRDVVDAAVSMKHVGGYRNIVLKAWRKDHSIVLHQRVDGWTVKHSLEADGGMAWAKVFRSLGKQSLK